MSSKIVNYCYITFDGLCMSPSDHSKECQRIKNSIKVIGYKWEVDDPAHTTIIKRFDNPKHGVGGDLLTDRTGIIMTEPPEIVGDKFVVVYNVDGSERFRLKPRLDPDKFPAYLKDARLVGYQFFYDKPHAHFETNWGERVLEFDLTTGEYTGKHWEVR